jgi:putative transposase
MAKENPLLGAERIRGELLKLNIGVSKRTVRKYLRKTGPRPQKTPTQNWSTFLRNHSSQIMTPVAAPKANALCERLIGTLRRECLDHLFILGEAHLKRILKEYVKYYNQQRLHQGIEQRLPEPGPPGTVSTGKILAFPILGGLHHSYEWAA